MQPSAKQLDVARAQLHGFDRAILEMFSYLYAIPAAIPLQFSLEITFDTPEVAEWAERTYTDSKLPKLTVMTMSFVRIGKSLRIVFKAVESLHLEQRAHA